MMKAEAEIYKGIEFVRLSALSADQRAILSTPAFYNKIIKILRGTELIVDCISYSFYQEWYQQAYPTATARKSHPTYSVKESA